MIFQTRHVVTEAASSVREMVVRASDDVREAVSSMKGWAWENKALASLLIGGSGVVVGVASIIPGAWQVLAPAVMAGVLAVCITESVVTIVGASVACIGACVGVVGASVQLMGIASTFTQTITVMSLLLVLIFAMIGYKLRPTVPQGGSKFVLLMLGAIAGASYIVINSN
jgi:hypothetical protein